MDGVMDLLQNFGFPVVCFLLCAWYVKYREDKNDEQMAKLVQVHSSETDKLSEAINNNTLVLQKLIDKMDGIVQGGEYYDNR